MRLTSSSTGSLAGRKQLKVLPVCSVAVCPRRSGHVLHTSSSSRPAKEHRTRLVPRRVIEQSKSSAEAFIESVQESLRDQRLEVEESVVATDIGELQQQVNGLEKQVRCVTSCMGRCCWFGLYIKAF